MAKLFFIVIVHKHLIFNKKKKYFRQNANNYVKDADFVYNADLYKYQYLPRAEQMFILKVALPNRAKNIKNWEILFKAHSKSK